ncbi:hypothetical protein [Alteromonas sp. a30]|uniref:hypothetical protein n=1 Tax=Alteromonas sp. a30 TaxID=2730917 RepID=UPI002280DAEC|nr:hypothetical protein [Alteromonas sp. a30]MCY7297130.1 hypothetical protein [Alteromonas sp. a30]
MPLFRRKKGYRLIDTLVSQKHVNRYNYIPIANYQSLHRELRANPLSPGSGSGAYMEISTASLRQIIYGMTDN